MDAKTPYTLKTIFYIEPSKPLLMKLKFTFNYSYCVFEYVRDSNIYILFDYKPINLFSEETSLCFYAAVNEMLHFQDIFIYNRLKL